MSMHKIELTSIEREGLVKHKLRVDAPSQMADCFRLGFKWAQDSAPQSEWISVADRLPPIEEKGENSDPDMVYTHTSDVIALLSSGDTVRTYHDGDVWCYHDLSGCPQYDVTHWMPLPKPPKGA